MTPSSSTQVLCAVIVLFVVLHPGYGDDGFDNTSMIADEYINNTSDEQSVDYRKNHSSEEDVSQMELESSGDDDFHAGVLIKMLADQNKYMFNMMKDRDDALKKLSQMESRQQSEAHQKELDSTGIELQSVRTEMESIKTSLQTELQSTKRELESTKSKLQSTQIGLESTKSNLQSTQTKLESTQTKLESTQTKLESTQTDLQSTKAKLDSLLGDLVKIEKNLGSTYIHWGRRNCSDGNNNVTLVYSGILGGKLSDHKGSGTNALCLTLKPKYENKAKPAQYAFIYGSYYNVEGFKHSITCSVCRTSYPSTIMVPGTYTCPAGWIPQYTGYLMASSVNNYANEFLCIDGQPQMTDISTTSSARFSMVTTNCAGLSCPPYIPNEMFTCVVCSKQ